MPKGEVIDLGLGAVTHAVVATLSIGSAEIDGADAVYVMLKPTGAGPPLAYPIRDRATADDIRDQLATLINRVWPQGG